jgi:hypothetical protein
MVSVPFLVFMQQRQDTVTKPQYIESLVAFPWRFPAAEDFVDVPSEWAAEAWDVEAVRSPLVHELRRDVSKSGKLCLREKQLEKMSELLRTDQAIALYKALRNDSPHRESEFRSDFLRLFEKHASQLPPELTRDQIIAMLGVDDATATELFGEE